jgi:plasmid stabilization system protein ParE
MRVVLTAKAKRDLFRIYSYIDERNPSAAESIIQRIRNNFDKLGPVSVYWSRAVESSARASLPHRRTIFDLLHD